MKQVLSLLLSFIVLQTQTWALSGGPVFNSVGLDVAGSYSGVLIPVTEAGVNVGAGFNTIGVFSIDVPRTGISTGALSFFGNAQAYRGTISGIADPDKGTFQGILDAASTLRTGGTTSSSSNGTTSTTSSSVSTFVGQAIGSIRANIEPPVSSFSAAQARLTGSAHLDVFEGQFNADLSVKVASTFDFVVDGFKQAAAP